MKKKYFYFIIALFLTGTMFSQTTEDFETETDGATTFTNNGQVFNVSTQAGGTFDIINWPQTGWNGTAKDNKYIDNSATAYWDVPVSFTVSSAGQRPIVLKSFYLFLSTADLLPGAGSCTITGKLKGVTVFTATSSTGFNSNPNVNNGFTKIDFTTYGGSDNSNAIVDQYVVTTTGTFEYVALDAMLWQDSCSTLKLTPSSQTNLLCGNASNGAASVNVATGGGGGYTYDWAPDPLVGDGTRSVSGLTAGTWVCTVTDTNSCTTTQSFTITAPAAISVTPNSQTNIACYGGATGAASINVPTGGTGSYMYNWTPGNPIGDGTTSVSGLTVGEWTCTITDANGCTTSRTFTINQPAVALSALTGGGQTNVSCFGGSNGSATVAPTGGTPGYSYSWSPSGGTGATASGLTRGDYTCTITDANGCTTSRTFTINQPAAALSALAGGGQTNVSCFGGSNGSATVAPTGGTPGYSYSWSPSGGTGAMASGLTRGDYTCTITDANGCTTSRTFTINQPAVALSALTGGGQTNVSCYGGSNGSATVVPTGGTPGYSYSWSPSGGTGATASGLTRGDYTCTITDANGCTTIRTFTVNQPAAALSALAGGGQTNVSCFGGSNGSATVAPTGGAPGYSYSWSPSGGTGATASGLTRGDYTCTITDANGCTTSRTFTINQPAAALSALAGGGQTNVSCFGGSNGSATVAPTGGTPGYSYSWSPSGGTGATASGLTRGDYTCTVTDANGCTTSRTFTINQPAAALSALAGGGQTNVSCFGGSNGSATVAPTGGTPGYSYSWSPSGGTGAMASGLTRGDYTCTITDANGCTTSRTFTINQPAVALSALTGGGQTNVSCFGGSNGSATVAPTGGTPGYSYSWSPSGGTGATASGLTRGDYTCTITDANGCTTSRTFTINQPAAALSALTGGGQTNVSCFGGSNGSATVAPTGGTPGYSYSWSPSGGTGATASGLTRGDYTCTITDANGCTTSRTFTINQPAAALSALAGGGQTNVSCFGGSNGSATVAPTGGTPGYSYSWSPSGGTGATASGLTRGDYTCTITDANGCTTSRTFTINQPAAALSALTGGGQTNVSCFGGSNGSATVAPTGGTPSYSYSWSPSGGTGATASGLTAGTYTCAVTDANGCEDTRSFVITEPAALSFTTTALPGYDFNTLYSQTIVATGGTGIKSYAVTAGSLPSGFTLLSNGEISGTSTQVADSNFTVTVTDGNTCTATYNMSLKINQIPITVTAVVSQTKEYGQDDPVLAYIVMPSLQSGDTFSGSLDRAAGEGVGNYVVNAGNLSAGSKYLMTFVGADFSITAKPITVTAAASQAKVYGAVDPVFVYTVSPSLVGTDVFSGALTRATGENVGTYAIGQGNLSAGANYSIAYVNDDFAITAKPITVTADASQAKVYGAVDPVFAYSVSPSLVGSDAFTGTLTRATGENIGTYAIGQGSLSAGANYSIAYVDTDFAITAKPITVTADASQAKEYGVVDPIFRYSVSPGLVSGDIFTGTLARTAGENVGTYAIGQGSLSAGANYNIAYVDSDFAITVKPITVTAAASQAKVYGAVDPVFVYSVSPSLVGSDTFTGTLSRANGENVGTYAIGQGSLSAGTNYNIAYVDTDFAITVKPITVTADASQAKVYGTADPVFAYSVSPSLVSGDLFTGTLTRTAGENVGTYDIGQGSLSAGSNYSIAYVDTDFGITAKPITVTADASQAKVYGTVDPVFAYSVFPSLVGSDAFTGTLSRVPGENVGAYLIGQGSLTAGANYSIAYVDKNFSITAKSITVTADTSQAKVYGAVDPVFAYSVSPTLVGGDAFTGLLKRAAGENVGTYTIGQGSLSAGSNYSIAFASADFVITAKPITVTAAASQTKIYGKIDPIFVYSVSPSLVGSDTFKGALSRVTGENVGAYAIKQGSLSAGTNYSIAYIGDDFTITKSDQIITWNQTLGLGCDGENTILLTATSNSGLPLSYTSSKTDIVMISDGSLVFKGYGEANVTVSQVGDSNYNAAPVVVLPVVNTQPNLIRKQFDNVIFFDNSSKSFESYSWYKDGVLVPGQVGQFFKENGPLNGVYSAKAVRKDGMSVTTCPMAFSPSIEEEYLKIAPNPVKTNSGYQLITNVSSSKLQSAHVEVFNMLGMLLTDKIINEKTTELIAPNVEGIYIVRMTLTNGKYFTKNLLVKN